MENVNEIALVIWIKDNPIRGGVLKLADIISPRREYADYKAGEVVQARCRGFKGKHECLLGRIGGKSRKAEFEELLLGTSFFEILAEFGLQQNIPSDQDIQNVEEEQHNGAGVVEVPIEAATIIRQDTPDKVVTKPVKQKEKRKNPSPKKRANSTQLVQIANDLELTELQESVQHDGPVTQAEVPSIGSAFHKPRTPAKRKCVGSVVRGGLMALDHENQEENGIDQSPVKGKPEDCSCGCKAEIERLSKACNTFEQEFTSMWYWIHLLYNSSQQQQVSQQQQDNYNNSQQQANSLQFLHQSPIQRRLPFPETESTPQRAIQMAQSPQPSTSQLLESPQDGLSLDKSPTLTYGGFTKTQLLEDVSEFDPSNYAKAAKRLFRRLYKEEEWVGHTLTGAKANSKYDGRPAIEDLSKMNIIYEIMQEQFKVTPVQVREKVRDLLKPSKIKKV